MPRPKNEVQKEKLLLSLDPTIAATLELIGYSPTSERGVYGIKGQVVETALRQYFTNFQNLKRGRTMTTEEQQAVAKAEEAADAKEAAGEYPDPATMDPKEREAAVMTLRRRILAGEHLPSADIRHGLLMMRAGRTERRGRVPGGGKGRAAKPAVEAFELSDFS